MVSLGLWNTRRASHTSCHTIVFSEYESYAYFNRYDDATVGTTRPSLMHVQNGMWCDEKDGESTPLVIVFPSGVKEWA